jgi:serine/threonine-protein kinase
MVTEALAPGTMVGEYRVERLVGEGTFGKVHAAVQPVIGKGVAIKVLGFEHAHKPQFVSRFIEEARAVNRIRHRNIVDIFGFGVLPDGRHYFVMELLEGETLSAYLARRGRLPPAEALGILRKVARALEAAHGAGIAHRDLKPDNVFITFDEEGAAFPKLLDFGIAKLIGDAPLGHRTATGTPMGTPLYMSPEQCKGQVVDHRTDIYAFGVLAFEMLTGRRPFDADNVMEVLMAHMSTPAPPPSSKAPGLPPALDAALLALLEKDPQRRPPSILAAMNGIEAAFQGSVALPPSTTPSAYAPVPTYPQAPAAYGAQTAGTYDAAAPHAHGAPAAAQAVTAYAPYAQAAPTHAPRPGTLEPYAGQQAAPRRPASGGRTGAIAAAVVVVLALGGGAVWLATRERDRGEETETSTRRKTATTAPAGASVELSSEMPEIGTVADNRSLVDITASRFDGGTMRQAHQLQRGSRRFTILETTTGDVSRLRVDVQRSEQALSLDGGPQQVQPAPIAGRSYLVSGEGSVVQTPEGAPVTPAEQAAVQQEVGGFFGLVALNMTLDDRELRVGDKVPIDDATANRVFGAEGVTASRCELTLGAVEESDDERIAVFDMRLDLVVRQVEGTLATTLVGKYRVRADDLWPLSLRLDGQVVVDMAGSAGPPGTMIVESTTSYEEPE